MRLPLFVAPTDGERSCTVGSGESSSSNTKEPAVLNGRGLAQSAAHYDLATWSSSSSPPFTEQSSAQQLWDHFLHRMPVHVPVSPRPVARSFIHEGSPEAFGAALLLLELSDSEDTNDSDYIGGNDFEDEGVVVTDYSFRIKLDLNGNYTITHDFPDPDGSHVRAEGELRSILLAGLERIRRDNTEMAEPICRNPELAFDRRGFYPDDDVPIFPTLLPEAQTDAGKQRLSSTMALNVQDLTNTLAESAREHAALLEQRLDQAKGEFAMIIQELAETKEKLAARDEQIRRIQAILGGL